MQTPPPVSGEAYPIEFTSETRSNYLRGGLTFDTAYSDNVLTASNGKPVSDVSYSVWPTIAIDQTRSRLQWGLSYAPGFTFYQRTSARNEADHNVKLNLRYRLSPHVTINLGDSFQKSSSVFNQLDQNPAGAVSGSVQGSSVTVVPPVADRLSNSGTGGITYQFSPNGMVGASGTFTNLHYPNPSQVSGSNPALLTGIYDASTRGGSAFFSQRFSKKHYIGGTYQYQLLISYPSGVANGVATRTQAILLFYTFFATPQFSVSLFGGPQYSSTDQLSLPASQAWFPAAGASLNWQARHSALAIGYSHMITGGGGLIGASQSDTGSASFREQISKHLTASLTGSYGNNDVITVSSLPNTSGHLFSGSASLERQLGEHLSLRAGFTRLHQVYRNVAVITPDTSRESVSISYEFARPLGR